jgi:hypothetical protein
MKPSSFSRTILISISLAMGGSVQGNTKAVIDSWERMLQFFGSIV